MSRIPSKAMPHAYAPSEGDAGSDPVDGGGQSIGERAGELAKKVGGSRAARVAAGAVVAGAVAAAATKIVRNRKRKGEDSSGT